MEELVDLIKKNYDIIKNEIMSNRLTFIDTIVNSVLVEVGV